VKDIAMEALQNRYSDDAFAVGAARRQTTRLQLRRVVASVE
jgi:hypothetical protein